MSYERDKELTNCIICGEPKPAGIKIYTGFICDNCEKEIVQTEVEDKKYSYFIQKLKTLWLKDA